jgi:hypothetical protein
MAAAGNLRLVGSGIDRRLVHADGSPLDSSQQRVRLVGVGRGNEGESRDGPCWPEPVPVRRDLFEIASVGQDPNLQLIGSDPQGSSGWAGLIVPSAVTPDPQHRYLFLLAWMRLDANRWGRIRGIRTSVLLGASVASTVAGVPYPVEHEIQNPFWKPPNGNVCFFFQKIPSPPEMPYDSRSAPSLSFIYSNSPALLYQNTVPYQPPGAGMPPGVPISPGLGTWYDGRFSRWRSEHGWDAVDFTVRGPCDIGLFCSVFQMQGLGQPVPAPGVMGLPPDDAFLQNNPGAQFRRVAGAFVWQEDTAK